jgi:hypothetical protein
MEKSPAYKPQVRELAVKIYVDLVSSNVIVGEGKVRMGLGADSLARLSFQLAEAFQGVEDELNTPNVTRQSFKLEGFDITEWSK